MMYISVGILAAIFGPLVVLASKRPTHPAEETHDAAKYERNLAEGWTPRPTDGPKAIFGRMELQPRLDGYTMGPATCGFIPKNNNVIACQSAGDVCQYESSYAGCCEPNKSCSAIKKKCYDYSESLAGSCSDLKDFHTICCRSRATGQCFTWRITMTGGNGQPSGRFTLLDCSSTSGSGTLLNYDPLWAQTYAGEPTPTPTPTPTPISDPTTPPTPTVTETEGSKTNVGAIAGGTVGGVAALALVGTAVFLLLRRRKDDGKTAAANASPSPPMSQQPYSPVPQSQHSGSHGSQQPCSPQPYDPHMSTYSQQGYAAQQGYQQPYNTQYPQQQWSSYGHSPSFSATDPSPGPYATPSPGVQSMGVAGGEQRHVSELQAVNPVGMESNRAELH